MALTASSSVLLCLESKLTKHFQIHFPTLTHHHSRTHLDNRWQWKCTSTQVRLQVVSMLPLATRCTASSQLCSLILCYCSHWLRSTLVSCPGRTKQYHDIILTKQKQITTIIDSLHLLCWPTALNLACTLWKLSWWQQAQLHNKVKQQSKNKLCHGKVQRCHEVHYTAKKDVVHMRSLLAMYSSDLYTVPSHLDEFFSFLLCIIAGFPAAMAFVAEWLLATLYLG